MQIKFILSVFLFVNIFTVKSQIDEDSSLKEDSQNTVEHEATTNERNPTSNEIFNQIKGFRIRSETELRFLTEISDLTLLLFLYRPYSENSIKIAHHVKTVGEKLGKLSSIVLIDCDNFNTDNYFPCRDYEYANDSFPRLKLLIPPEKRYHALTREVEVHSEYPWTEREMSENSIYNFVTKNIPDKSVKLNSDNIYGFLSSDLFNKVILFTNKKETGVLWRGLTGVFFDQLLFGEVLHESQINEQFNVTKLPSIILYKIHDGKRLLDEPEIVPYEGPIDADKLIEWLKPHALNEKRHVLQKRGVHYNDFKDLATNLELRKVNVDNYAEYFNSYPGKNILIYFNTKNVIKQSVKEFMVNSHPFFISAFYDCSNNRQYCLEKFNVTVFPSLKMFPSVESNNFEDRISRLISFNISKSNNIPLEHQIREIFPSKFENVTNLEFPYKIQNLKFANKLIILNLWISSSTTDSDEVIPVKPEYAPNTLNLDLLSNYPPLNSDFAFISLQNPTTEILNLNKIPSPSGIFFLQAGKNSDSYRVIPANRESSYKSLFTIADNLIWMKNNFKGRIDFHSDIIKQMTSSMNFRKECLDYEYCVLLFFDARPGENREEKFADAMIKIENAKLSSSRYDHIKFNWINATCHHYLANQFDVKSDNLPGLTFYYRWRGQFATYKGLFEDFLLREYLERCVNNRFPTVEIERDSVVMNNIVCEIITGDEKIEKIKHNEQEGEKVKNRIEKDDL